MPLIDCIRTAGKALDKKDADAVVALADQFEAEGMDRDAAERQAVTSHLSTLGQEMDTMATRYEEGGIQVSRQTPEMQEIMSQLDSDPEIQAAMAEVEAEAATAEIDTPERAQLRAEITQTIYDNYGHVDPAAAPQSVPEERRAVLILGPPGAGKSFLQRERYADWALVDSDEFKAMIPEFEGGKGANRVHLESKGMAKDVMDAFTQEGLNIVHPIIGHTKAKVEQAIADLQQKGYDVEVDLVYVSPQKSITRALDRWRSTGRFVPPSYIADTVGTRPLDVFTELVNEGKASEENAFTTENDTAQPLSESQFALGQRPDGREGVFFQSQAPQAPQNVDIGPYRVTSKKTGQIGGLPDGVTDQKGIDEVAGRYYEIASRALENMPHTATWYEDIGAEILRLTNNNYTRADRVARIFALLSSDDTVLNNTKALVEASYEIERGNTRPYVGRYPNSMGGYIESALAEDVVSIESSGFGHKTLPFYHNIHDAMFPDRAFDEGAVAIDRWMLWAEGFDRKRKSAGAAGARIGRSITAAVTQALNEQRGLDLKPRQVQALIWSQFRADDGVSEASYHDVLASLTQRVTWEAVPSMQTDEGKAFSSMNPQQQADVLSEAYALIRDESGTDLIAQQLGIPLSYVTEGEGFYDQALQPSAMTSMIGLRINGGAVQTEAVEAYAGVLQSIFKQEAVPWFRADEALRDDPDATPMSVLTFEGQIDSDRLGELAVEYLGEEAGFTVSGNEVYIANWVGLTTEEFYDATDAIAQSLGATHYATAAESEYGPTIDWASDPQGSGAAARYQGFAERSPALQEWVLDRQQAFSALFEGEPGPGGEQDTGPGSALPIRQDGKVELVHYSSREGLDTLDPARYGQGIAGAEARRKGNNPQYWEDRTYYGLGVGTPGGYVKEGRLGGNTYVTSLDPESLYDFQADPDGLKAQAREIGVGETMVTAYEQLIKKAGYSGYFTSNTQLGKVAAVFEPLSVEGNEVTPAPEVYYQPSKTITAYKQSFAQDKRAKVTLAPGSAIIGLSQASDLTSFFHEAGHLFLHMERQFSESPNATDRQVRDWQIILDFLGVESGDQIGVEQHEKFARAFERYIGEGKAPTVELRSVFRRFAQWVIDQYQNLTALNVELTDDIRGVMDRMLATDAQIERAAQKFGFDLATEAVEEVRAAKDTAKESLRTKLIRELRRRTTDEYKRERRERVSDAKERLADERRYKAVALMKETPVNRDAAKEALDIENLRDTPNLRGLTAANSAMNPDEMAMLFGYTSGQHMLQDIANNPTLNQAAEAEADAAMAQKELSDEQIEEMADTAIHNEEQATALYKQLRAMRSGQPPIDRDLLKSQAQEIIGALQIKNIRPSMYQRQEVKFARKYERALAEGDRQAAATAKQNQLMSFYMAREAMQARERAERQRAHMKAVQTREYGANVDPIYAQNLKVHARMYDFRKSGQMTTQAMQRLANWAKAQADNMNLRSEIFDLVMMRYITAMEAGDGSELRIRIPSYKDMTVDELQGVYDQSKHMRRLGGELSERSKADRKANNMKLSGSIREANPNRNVEQKDYQEGWENAKGYFRGYTLSMVNLVNQAAMLDGEQDGPAKEMIYDRTVEANNKKIGMTMAASQEMSEIFKKLPGVFRYKKRWKGGGDMKTVTRTDGKVWTLPARGRLMLALYWGSPESRQAILDGHGVTETDVQNMLNFLTDEEIDFVNSIWKFNEQFWPELSRISAEVYGASPPKVQAVPYTIRNKKLTGGYQRIYYDWSPKDDASRVEEESEGMIKGRAAISMSKTGSMNERIGSGGRRVLLDVNNIARATDESIHTIAFAEASKDIAYIMNDPDVKSAMSDKFGKEFVDNMNNTLEAIFRGNVAGMNMYNSFMRFMRSNLTFGYLAFSIRNILQQPIAITNAVGKLGGVSVMGGVIDVLRDPLGAYRFVTERSTFMQHRSKVVNRDTADQLAKINTPGIMGDKSKFFFLQTMGDMLVAYPTWMAAYKKGMEQYGNDKKASRYADDIVVATVGSGRAVDLAPALLGVGVVGNRGEQGSELTKQMTFMGSFFNVVFNDIYASIRQTDFKSPKQMLEFTRQMMWFLVIPAVLSRMVVSDFPWDEDGDDEDSFWQWATGAAVEYGMGGLFLFRDFAAMLRGFDPSLPYQAGISSLGRIGKEGAEVYEQLTGGDEEFDTGDMASILRGIQPLTKAPATSVARFLEYTHSYNEGNEGREYSLYDALVEGKERDE